MGGLASAMTLADPGFDPASTFTAMTGATDGITTNLTAKVASISTELPLSIAAAQQQNATQSVDAILAGNVNNIPNQIDAAFTPAGNCPTDYVKDSFKSVTQSNSIVASGNDAVAANFDNTGSMSTLYSAVNAVLPTPVTTGKELLAAINTGGASVTAAVTAAVAGSPSLLTQLKSSFTSVETTSVPGMSAAFATVVAESAASVQSALASITGGNTVGMINSSNPCVQAVMGSVIDQSKVDQNALALKAGLAAKTVSLPGTESVTAANMTAPLTLNSEVNKPVIPATQMITPVAGPTIQPYTDTELNTFRGNLVTQNDILVAQNKTNAEWYQSNVETWKVSVQYELKKTNAGATVQNPYGTSTNPTYLAEWKAVYDGNPNPDNYVYKRDIFNTQYQPLSVAARTKFDQMKSEYDQRAKYGQYPYTYQIAQGIAIPEDKQYTWLAPTK